MLAEPVIQLPVLLAGFRFLPEPGQALLIALRLRLVQHRDLSRGCVRWAFDLQLPDRPAPQVVVILFGLRCGYHAHLLAVGKQRDALNEPAIARYQPLPRRKAWRGVAEECRAHLPVVGADGPVAIGQDAGVRRVILKSICFECAHSTFDKGPPPVRDRHPFS